MKYLKNRLSIKNSQGFTIIELMIATAVFSLALLILAVALISINHQYFKGISEGNAQTASSNILSDVTSAVQFSNGNFVQSTLGSNPGYYCIGNTEFYYTLYSIDKPGQTNPFLEINKCLQGEPTQSNCKKPCSVSGLLGDNMQLLGFSISQPYSNVKLFEIKINIGFASNDKLFCSLVGSNSNCQHFKNSTQLANNIESHKQVFCVPNDPVEFCSIQNLSTYVSSRYNSYE